MKVEETGLELESKIMQKFSTAFHVLNAVPKISLAAINAQVSAARSVHWIIVKYALINKRKELTCLGSNPLAKWI